MSRNIRMLIVITQILCFTACAANNNSINVEPLFPNIKIIRYQEDKKINFAKYAFLQFRYKLEKDVSNGLYHVENKNNKNYREFIIKLINTAIENKAVVIVFPELSFAFEKKERDKIFNLLLKKSKEHDVIFIAGSFYDKNRRNVVPIIYPNGIDYSYKIKQSIFEVSPVWGKGMVSGNTIVVIKSKYGNIIPIVCVDLISDDIQYLVRYLSNINEIDVLINIAYNPASNEFIREMNAIVKRHNLFGAIVNVSDSLKWNAHKEKEFGNTSLITSYDLKACDTKDYISSYYKYADSNKNYAAYSNLTANLNPDIEGMILCDFNVRLVRAPKCTNAPDQGYPVIQNLKIIKVKRSEPRAK